MGPKSRPYEEPEERIETGGSKISGLSRQEKDSAWSSGGGRQAQEIISEASLSADDSDSEEESNV